MTGWRGLLAGALLLAALERLVSRPATAERAGGLFVGLSNGVEHFLSPDYPFFPAKGSSSSSTTSSSTSTPAQPAVPSYPTVTAQPISAQFV